MMKIMYLTDVGLDTPNSNNHLVISMLKSFVDAGHETYLVQSHSTGVYADIPKELEENKLFSCDTVPKAVVGRSNFVKRYLSAILYEYKAYKKWKKHIKDIDIVVLQSHYTAVYSAFLLNRYRKKVVFNIYDIFPGEAYTNGNIKSKFVYDFFKTIQGYLYKHCDKFFTLTQDTKETLISLGVEESKIVIIPNWFDESKLSKIEFENNKFAQEYSLSKEKKYIQYAGTVGVSYDFELVLDVASRLAYREDLVFQIVGEGLKLEELKEQVLKRGLSNVQFLPWQPLERLSDVYSACTVQIVPLRSDVIRNSYPSKILPLMACERIPVVSVEKDSFFYKEINENAIGIATPLGDVDALANSILSCVDGEAERERMQIKAKEYVYRKHTAKENTERMLKAFKDMQGECENE